ncbi:hypothetical protein KR222_003803 [Zaprionus bogoriensis]|nr:hypothetical protein KR222_003803 [Zaprionus bogoriensis]
MSKSARSGERTFRVNVRLHNFGTPFVGAFPDISRPEPIGYYCLNEDREFQDDASNAAYLYLPPKSALPLDLNAGIEKVQRKPAVSDYHAIQQMCQYIYNHQELLRESDTGLKLPADFVTFRGALRQIMCTPYERQNDYRLLATRLNGTIYLTRADTEAQRLEREQMSRRHLDMCSWGFKFEQYCTTPDPNIAPETSAPVNESKEFACVYRCKLDGLYLLYSAEMDCMRSDVVVNLDAPKQLSSVEFVELKTSAFDMNKKQQRSFDFYKSLNWWSQSFLVGIQTILAGLRDNNGLAHEIKEYSVSELHRNKPWSPAATGIFLSKFLHELKAVMEHINDSHTVVVLDYRAYKSSVVYSVLASDHGEPMLPEWYRQLMRGSPQS